MQPHTPPDPRDYGGPEHAATAPPRRGDIITERSRSTARAMLIATLVLVAIIALIVLL